MVRIRLSRHGSKKRPFYYLTVADRRKARDGRFIERIGHFNPLAHNPAERIKVNLERADYWLSIGGHASERVAQLIHNARRLEQGLPLRVRSRNKPKSKISPVVAVKATVTSEAIEAATPD